MVAMEWYWVITLYIGALILIMFTGLPIAFSFLAVSGGAMFMMFGTVGIRQLVLGIQYQLSNFAFTAIPFFIIMGEVFFRSGIITRVMDTFSKLVRKVPGRLCVITMLGGGVFAALSGSSLANIVMLGALMMPEMMRRGYCVKLTTGTIMTSGSLAMVIPPSNLLILLGGIAGISVADLILGAIIPGFLIAALFLGFIILRCFINPSLAPPSPDDDKFAELSAFAKLKEFSKNILPLIIVMAAVIGTIMFGIGTATEAATIGALASFGLTIAYGKFNFKLVVDCLIGSLRSTVMLLTIIAGSAGFGQVLALTGASRAAVIAVTGMVDSPMTVLLVMLGITFFIDLWVSEGATMMICLPLFMPLVHAYGINEVWFGIIFLFVVLIGQYTPPVGMALFAMKGASPPSISFQEIMWGGAPFLIVMFAMVILMLFFPGLVTMIPSAF